MPGEKRIEEQKWRETINDMQIQDHVFFQISPEGEMQINVGSEFTGWSGFYYFCPSCLNCYATIELFRESHIQRH